MSEGTGPLRIGTAERTSAMKALDAHLEAGRLGVEEYGERSARAANATLASELNDLFTDLPAPHPEIPGTAPLPALPATAQLPVVGSSGVVASRQNAFLDTWGPRIAAVTPVLAFAIFAISGFHAWWWFLLIPVVGGLVYGGRGGRDRDDDERRRDRRRDR
jgi:hypothetical protein